jgi:hypothetical protein
MGSTGKTGQWLRIPTEREFVPELWLVKGTSTKDELNRFPSFKPCWMNIIDPWGLYI